MIHKPACPRRSGTSSLAWTLPILYLFAHSCGTCPRPATPEPGTYVLDDPSSMRAIRDVSVTVSEELVVIDCVVNGVPTTVTYAVEAHD